MADITLVRQDAAPISDDDRAALLRVIFGVLDGLGDSNRKRWRGFWKRLLQLEPGEMVEIKTHQDRIGWYHRKHMLMEVRLFEAQEKFENFEQFRCWLKVGAGHCDWVPGPKGGVFPVPRTIKYSKLEQAEMEAFHASCIEFVRTEHAGKTMWKHLSVTKRIEMIEDVLANCGAFEM